MNRNPAVAVVVESKERQQLRGGESRHWYWRLNQRILRFHCNARVTKWILHVVEKHWIRILEMRLISSRISPRHFSFGHRSHQSVCLLSYEPWISLFPFHLTHRRCQYATRSHWDQRYQRVSFRCWLLLHWMVPSDKRTLNELIFCLFSRTYQHDDADSSKFSKSNSREIWNEAKRSTARMQFFNLLSRALRGKLVSYEDASERKTDTDNSREFFSLSFFFFLLAKCWRETKKTTNYKDARSPLGILSLIAFVIGNMIHVPTAMIRIVDFPFRIGQIQTLLILLIAHQIEYFTSTIRCHDVHVFALILFIGFLIRE